MEFYESARESVRDLFEAQVANFRVLDLLAIHEQQVLEVKQATLKDLEGIELEDDARERVAQRIAQTIVQPLGPGEEGAYEEQRHRWNAKATELAALARLGLPERDFTGLTIRRNLSARSRESMLVTLWSDFEAFVAELLRLLASTQPDPLVPSTKQVTLQEVVDHGSVDALVQHLASEWIDSLFRDTFDTWIMKLCTAYALDVPVWTDQLRESYFRRNVVVHAGASANSVYIKNTSELMVEAVEPDARLTVDREYLTVVADELAAVAFALAITAAAKFDKANVEKYEGEFTNLCYILLIESRPGAVRIIGERFRHERFKTQGAKEIMKVNYLLACRDLGQLSQCRKEINEWDVSALDEMFKIAKLILQEDYDKALGRVAKLRESNKLQERLWTTWPLFRDLRAFEKERQAQVDGQQSDSSSDMLETDDDPEEGPVEGAS